MKTRIITAVVALPVFLALLYFGGIWRLILCAALTVAALWEYCHALNQKLEGKMRFPLLMMMSLVILAVMKLDFSNSLTVLTGCFMVIFCSEVFFGRGDAYRGIASVFSLVYIPMMFGYLLLFDYVTKGLYYLWMVLIVAFVTDTMAYFVGMLIGKHKLCPRISPKKTVEGAVGGVIFAAIAMVAYGLILKQWFDFNLPLYLYAILGVIGSIFSQCGDLTASLIKRKVDVKDFGKILPGHGGILDRFDSILFALPVVYTFATYTYGML